MLSRTIQSSPALSFLLLIGTAAPFIAQAAKPTSPSPNIVSKKSDQDIALAISQRENAVWLENFIVAHPGQIEIGADLAIAPSPCDAFTKDNNLSAAPTFCDDVRQQYIDIQDDILAGTNTLPNGWKQKLEIDQKKIVDDNVHVPVHVHTEFKKPDIHFNQLAASAIGRVIDLSNGIFSRGDKVAFEGKNLLASLQGSDSSDLRTDLTNYLVQSIQPPSERVSAVQAAVEDSVNAAVNLTCFDYFYITSAFEQGLSNNPSYIYTAAQMEADISKYLANGVKAAADAKVGIRSDQLRAENNRNDKPFYEGSMKAILTID